METEWGHGSELTAIHTQALNAIRTSHATLLLPGLHCRSRPDPPSGSPRAPLRAVAPCIPAYPTCRGQKPLPRLEAARGSPCAYEGWWVTLHAGCMGTWGYMRVLSLSFLRSLFSLRSRSLPLSFSASVQLHILSQQGQTQACSCWRVGVWC